MMGLGLAWRWFAVHILFRMVHISKPENNIITQENTKQTKARSRQHPMCAAASMSWQAQVEETELPEADGCNNKTDGSRDCERHSQLSSKVVNVIATTSTCIRVNGLTCVLVCLLVLLLGLQ